MPSRSSSGRSVEGAIIEVMASEYGLHDARLHRFSPEHSTYLVTDGSRRLVLRIGNGQQHHVAALQALEAADYPAPRVIPTLSGTLFSAMRFGSDTIDLVLTNYIEGASPTSTPHELRALGTALGHLHRCGPTVAQAGSQPETATLTIERATMLPDNELRFALRHLAEAEAQLPNRDAAAQWEQLMIACQAGLTPVPGLTQAFLHGDAHPWNCILTPSGRAQYIDWDSAGPGPAIIDLAFVVLSCATGGLTRPVEEADPAAISALLEGYRSQVSLSSADLDALDGAITFRTLVCTAVGFSHYASIGKDPMTEPSIGWSFQRLRASPEIADTIRTALSF